MFAQDRRHVKSVVDNVCGLCNHLFDHSRIIASECQHLHHSVESWSVRDLEREMPSVVLAMNKLCADLPLVVACQQATLDECKRSVHSSLDFCSALVSSVGEKRSVHRNRLLQSERRLQSLRHQLNNQLRDDWHRQQRRHEMEINATLVSFGQPPMQMPAAHQTSQGEEEEEADDGDNDGTTEGDALAVNAAVAAEGTIMSSHEGGTQLIPSS